MGIEILVGVLAVLSWAFGLVFPVVGWALWSNRSRRLLVAGLSSGNRVRVTDCERGDADAPVRIRLNAGELEVSVRAVTRGRNHLWHFELGRLEPTHGPTAVIVERAWRDASRAAKELAPVDVPRVLEARGYLMCADDAQAAQGLLSRARVLDAAVAAIGYGSEGKELTISPSAVTLEVKREGLNADEALVWLTRLLVLVDALDGGRVAARMLPPGGPAAGRAGSSVGVPTLQGI